MSVTMRLWLVFIIDWLEFWGVVAAEIVVVDNVDVVVSEIVDDSADVELEVIGTAVVEDVVVDGAVDGEVGIVGEVEISGVVVLLQ